MKVFTTVLSLFFIISLLSAQEKLPENQGARIEKVINSQWTFNYFSSAAEDNGYESPAFNDSRWPAVSLPHTWNSYETTGEPGPFTRSPAETGETLWWTGWGWYRKHFSVSAGFSDRKVFLEFEGVQKYCKVWINGKYAGDHKGGYGSFDFEITGYLKPGEDNVLAVAVSNLQKDEFRVHSLTEGSSHVSCGIYRDVRLVLKNKLYIPMQGASSHEGGTFITTPAVSANEGTLNIKTWVKNDYPQAKECILQTTISGKDNQVVQVIRSGASIASGQTYMFDQTSKPVKNPHLWSVADPYLYTVYSEVIDKKDVADSYTSHAGFRWFTVNENDHSVLLNGNKTELSGVNRHQEYPWLGDAVPGWITDMDYSDIAVRMGYNFVRTVNSPGKSQEYELTDNHGIIAEEDFSAAVSGTFTPDEQKQQIREMIRRDRNHPSIISWGIVDEPGKNQNAEFAATEDSTRIISLLTARVDTSSRYLNLRAVLAGKGPASEDTGQPAKIILSCPDKKIESDRGSVTLLLADITDSKGHHIIGAKNNLKWKVTGPARLVGPSFYASYADSNRNSGEGWYLESPAINIIRSTGRPGRISVTAFSSGLASGSVEIDAEESVSGDSAVTEPVLSGEGRKSVGSKVLVTQRLEEIPQEIAAATLDFSLPAVAATKYAAIMKDFIIKNNPSVDTSSVEFRTLDDLLAGQLSVNGGSLSAADYNFNAGHYNICRLISGYIAATKLPPLFKESLREHYSSLLIKEGREKNAGDEMDWLNWIPSGGIVVIVPDVNTNRDQKGVIFSKLQGLPDIIKVVYPQFVKFSDEARQRALIFISRMNPSVQVSYRNKSSMGGEGDSGTSVTYTAEKGKPILIPEFKFINE